MRKWQKVRDEGWPFELTITAESFTLINDDGTVPAGVSITLTEELLDAGIESGLYYEGCFNSFRCDPTPYAGWPERFWFLKTNYEGFDKGV